MVKYCKSCGKWYAELNGVVYDLIEFCEPVSAEIFEKELENEYNRENQKSSGNGSSE